MTVDYIINIKSFHFLPASLFCGRHIGAETVN